MIKKFFTVLTFGFFVFCGSAPAQQEVELNGPEYVASLHQDAQEVQVWLDSAKKNQETTKIAEIDKRLVELKALLSMIDALMAVKNKEQFDRDGFSSANNRFNNTFREADAIARLDEAQLAAMKKVDDEQLLNTPVSEAPGIYTSGLFASDEDRGYDENALIDRDPFGDTQGGQTSAF